MAQRYPRCNPLKTGILANHDKKNVGYSPPLRPEHATMRDIETLRFAAHEAAAEGRAGHGGNHQPGLAAYSQRNPGLTPFPALPRLPEYRFREVQAWAGCKTSSRRISLLATVN